MDLLDFQIFPSIIPRGRSIEAKLIVSHSGRYAIQNLRGHLKLSPFLHLLGLDAINIPNVPAEGEVSLPIRIMGEKSGTLRVSLSQLNAKSATGNRLNFGDRKILVEVSVNIELNPGDVSLMIEPVNQLVHNQIGQVKVRLHNNFIFPLSVREVKVSAHGGDCYLGRKPGPTNEVSPGSAVDMDVQVLPRVAGVINISTQIQFLIQGQSFTQQSVQPCKVSPRQPISSPGMENTKIILLVSASPQNRNPLRSDKEMKNILFEMKHSAPLRERFRVEVLPAATTDDLSREVIYLCPYLIHFSGHATEEGILLEDDSGAAKLVPTADLLALLRPLSDQIECVILNACESLRTARELAQCIPYVIAMRQEVLDPEAIAFSKGFYVAIGAGHTINRSFELGKAQLALDHFSEIWNPVLFNQGRGI